MNKNLYLGAALSILLILFAVGLFAYTNKTAKTTIPNQPSQTATETTGQQQIKTQDEILKNALNLYILKKEEGINFSNGPCLGQIAPDWVLDIAHNPRQPIDDKVENQCPDFREGRAHHFIELDPEGKLIKSY